MSKTEEEQQSPTCEQQTKKAPEEKPQADAKPSKKRQKRRKEDAVVDSKSSIDIKSSIAPPPSTKTEVPVTERKPIVVSPMTMNDVRARFGQHAHDNIDRPSPAFPSTMCVVGLDFMSVPQYPPQHRHFFVFTAIAICVIDVLTDELIFAHAWKVKQMMCPTVVAERTKTASAVVMRLITDYEREIGYKFTDKTSQSCPLGRIQDIYAMLCAQCGMRTAAVDNEVASFVFSEQVEALPVSGFGHRKRHPQRPRDILADTMDDAEFAARSMRTSCPAPAAST